MSKTRRYEFTARDEARANAAREATRFLATGHLHHRAGHESLDQIEWKINRAYDRATVKIDGREG